VDLRFFPSFSHAAPPPPPPQIYLSGAGLSVHFLSPFALVCALNYTRYIEHGNIRIFYNVYEEVGRCREI
jgi:hypothetical protein